MTAKIIPFPLKCQIRSRQHAHDVGESPAVLQLMDLMEVEETGTRPHWTGYDEHMYEHFRSQGLNELEAVIKIEQEIILRSARLDGEDWLIREARQALLSARKL